MMLTKLFVFLENMVTVKAAFKPAVLRLDHSVSQTTARCDLTNPIPFQLQSIHSGITHPLYIFFYPDNISKYRLNVKRGSKLGCVVHVKIASECKFV